MSAQQLKRRQVGKHNDSPAEIHALSDSLSWLKHTENLGLILARETNA